MAEKTVLMTFRVPPELKAAFEFVAEKNDQTSSQVIRKLMKSYIEEAAHAALLRQIAAKAQS
jgi:predicted DNA-binding protein